MKQIAAAMLVGLLATACYKKPDEIKETPVSKTVQFRMAQANDYSLPMHDGLKAEVKLSIVKESTIDGAILAAWDTTFALRSIREYPNLNNPLIITKHINDVWQSRQVLRVSRVIRYINAANQIVQNAAGEAIPTQITTKEVVVNL
jgi:hypothetical protein